MLATLNANNNVFRFQIGHVHVDGALRCSKTSESLMIMLINSMNRAIVSTLYTDTCVHDSHETEIASRTTWEQYYNYK